MEALEKFPPSEISHLIAKHFVVDIFQTAKKKKKSPTKSLAIKYEISMRAAMEKPLPFLIIMWTQDFPAEP